MRSIVVGNLIAHFTFGRSLPASLPQVHVRPLRIWVMTKIRPIGEPSCLSYCPGHSQEAVLFQTLLQVFGEGFEMAGCFFVGFEAVVGFVASIIVQGRTNRGRSNRLAGLDFVGFWLRCRWHGVLDLIVVRRRCLRFDRSVFAR